MLARLALVTAACALAGAAAAGPDVGWQSYENALKISATTGKPVCLVFFNDKVELNGGT
jgi:hypothetical protein